MPAMAATKLRRATKTKTPEGEWIPKFLASYLATDVDPYDFGFAIEEWGDSIGLPGLENDFESLTDAQQKAFVQWLSKDYRRNAHRLGAEEGARILPYLLFSDPRPLPRGSWLLHFTRSSPFDSFDRGATLEYLALSTHVTPTRAKCPDNLSEYGGGPFEVVFGFGFHAALNGQLTGTNFRAAARKYGGNAVLFRTDLAVLAHHDSDNEYQAIFPICSEYDAVAIRDINSSGGGETSFHGRDVEFDSLTDIMKAIDAKTARTASSGAARGSTQKRARWSPLFR